MKSSSTKEPIILIKKIRLWHVVERPQHKLDKILTSRLLNGAHILRQQIPRRQCASLIIGILHKNRPGERLTKGH